MSHDPLRHGAAQQLHDPGVHVLGILLPPQGLQRVPALRLVALFRERSEGPDGPVDLEQIGSPMLAMALGERRKELRYYRTGVPELTREDMELITECLKQWDIRVKERPEEREKFLDVVFKRGFL